MVNPVRFTHFELRPIERLLLAQGQPVALGSRAFDVLRVLVDKAGELVRKDELLDQVWPGLVVEENNLQVQISALRRALGVKAIATIPGQGYRFALPVERAPVTVDPAAGHAAPAPRPAPAGVPQRRSVTLLQARFEGLQRLLAQAGPEALDDALGLLQPSLQAILDNRGGLLSRFDMLGFEALFGLPSAHEDDVLQAAEAGLELVAEVQRQGRSLGAALGLRVGVAHGSVVASPVAVPAGWRIAGGLPPLAAALAAAVPRHEVAVCEDTRRLLSPYFQLQPLWAATAGEAADGNSGAQPPTAALPAWRLGARTGADSRIDAAMARGFTPLVGRADELDTLRGWLDEALRGSGHAVNVVADAGFGKSRLMHEFRQRIGPQEATVLTTRCSPQGRLGAFLPFIQLLREALALAGVPAAERESRAVQQLLAIDAHLQPWLPHLLHLLSIPSSGHPLPATLEGDARRHALGQALVATLTVAAAATPLVLVFDDWHWADEASGEVLEQLVDVVASHRILIVVTARPQTALAWSRHVHCSQLGLRPLTHAQTTLVVRSMCEAGHVPAPIADAIHARTEGNPFFAEELCRTLLDLGHLHLAEDGGLAARRPLATVELPSTIEAVIQARLDLLPPEAQAIARLAAVIGREFTRSELQALWPEPEQVPPALQVLATAALVQPTRLVPEPAYRFRHALSQVVAYDSLLQRQRRELHEQVGRLLELRQADRLDDALELLAYHFGLGTSQDKAVDYALRAGAKAARQAAHAVAARHFQAAIDRLEAHADGTSHDDAAAGRLLDAHVALGHSLTLLHGYAEPQLVHTCERARQLSRQGGPMASRFAASWMLWRYYYNRAQLLEAEAMAEQLLTMAQAADEPQRLLAAHTARGIVLYLQGRCAEAAPALQAALALHEPATEAQLALQYGASPTVMAGSFLGSTLNVLGDTKGAERACRQAQALAAQLAHPGSQALAGFYLSGFLLLNGHAPQALAEAQALAELAQRHEFAHWLLLARMNAALAQLPDPARAVQALADYRTATEAVMAAGVDLLRIPYHLVLARVSLQTRQPEQVQQHLQAAEAAMQQGRVGLFELPLRSVRALALLATDVPAALQAFGEAMALAGSRQARLQQLDIALDLAQALRRAGRLQEAPRLLGPALDTLRQAAATPLVTRLRQLVEGS